VFPSAVARCAIPPISSGDRLATGAPVIASRAYGLFLQRGGEHGRDLDDWLLARRELLPLDAEG